MNHIQENKMSKVLDQYEEHAHEFVWPVCRVILKNTEVYATIV